MKSSVYSDLRRKTTAIILLLSFSPLILLGGTIYHQFARMYKEKIREQISYRAGAQSEAVDLFLKERTAILTAMAGTHGLEQMTNEATLAHILDVMNSSAGAFVDLGVIDQQGRHLAYVGPYELKGLSYGKERRFAEVMNRGVYISDVYMGFRRMPHFIIAVRRQENNRTWVLRTTIDPVVFGRILRAAWVGRTGDAYIVDRQGIYQTPPRFNGRTLSASQVNPNLFGGRVTVIELENGHGQKRLYAGRWLSNEQWLLVVSQEVQEEMSGLFATRHLEIIIIAFGALAILLAALFTTRIIVKRLQEYDDRVSRLNAQLVQSDKLAALGKMAAGVAHEINNPLAVIVQKTGWMEDLLAEEEFQGSANYVEFQRSLHKIEEHVERARKVVHNMLGYARKMEPRLEDVDVNETLDQTIELLDNYARNNTIEIRKEFAENLPIIANDQARLQQVFLNLMTNAIDAIGKEGTICVRSVLEGDFILAQVEDSGPGIPADLQKKVFDPFFSTKTTGKGVGLGLWVSYDIMNKMGGTITFVSEPGQGTTFTVSIPVRKPEIK